MNSTKYRKEDQDVSLSLALLLLILVLGCLFFNPFNGLNEIEELVRLFDENILTATLLVASLSINTFWTLSLLGRLIGYRAQGSRIRLLRKKERQRVLTLSFGVPFLLGFSTSLIFHQSVILLEFAKGFAEIVGMDAQVALVGISIFLSYSFAIILAHLVSPILSRLLYKSTQRLPKLPTEDNQLVLGSTGEDGSVPPCWVSLNQKALSTNILITSSIGSGKTQGTILPYFTQLIENFNPRPSILAIDPKGTFIPEASKICKKNGVEDQVLHLKLGGDVRFNPIYLKEGLKDANFMRTAEMIRAASVNFLGKSTDSPFWERQGFNLVKNCLIYCIAKYDYYTLTEFYTALVDSTKKSLSEELTEILSNRTYEEQSQFDEEETFNIEKAIEYFENEYTEFDTKLKSGILATATTFLNLFQEYQAHKVFCPKKEEITISTMNQVIDDGKLLFFDIDNPGLSKSMGTFVKLYYEQAVLDRLRKYKGSSQRLAAIVVDEYQDVVTAISGSGVSDQSVLAKGREGNFCMIAATQSLSSLYNSVGNKDAVDELIQNFRNRLVGHSSDFKTVENLKNLLGQKEIENESHTLSEVSQAVRRNYLFGGFDSAKANVSESFNVSKQKEFVVTGKDLSELRIMEFYGIIFDGINTSFKKVFAKPHFLDSRKTSHKDVIEKISTYLKTVPKAVAMAFCFHLPYLASTNDALAFPSICSVMNTAEFNSCTEMKVGVCMCGWPPRPCAKLTYYIPQTFIEVMPDRKETFFKGLPMAEGQLASVQKGAPFGAEGDEYTQSFESHLTAVPFTEIAYEMMPCGGARTDKTCFDAMSEHVEEHWKTGSGDRMQPKFLLWSASPKLCLIKGALSSGHGTKNYSPSSGGMCSVNMGAIPSYPPSSAEVCTGWGVMFPRYGTYNGPSSLTGALMIAARMKSLASEVFQSTPSSTDEKWQMISPQSSSCFNEGQNVGMLETIKNVREMGRLKSGKLKGHLFVTWKKVSCCKDVEEVAEAVVALQVIRAACKGLGAL